MDYGLRRQVHLNDEWILYSERKREISRLDVLIITAALGSNTFACTRHIPLIGLGGQLSLADPTSQSLALRATILGQSYITPACGNMHAVGSTHIRGNQIYDSIAFNPTKEGHWQNYKNLEKCKSKKFQNHGVLVKFPKKKQDLRIDLPTVGLKTMKQSKAAGLKGIVVKGNQHVFLDKNKCISFANKNKMFISVK